MHEVSGTTDITGAGPEGASSNMTDRRTARIRALNDTLRHSFEGGDVVMTVGIQALPNEEMARVLRDVQRFDAFTTDSDPYGEHDFGKIERESGTYFWKIDCYDSDRAYGSPDPADPAVATRVLTIMRAEEY